MGAIIFHFPPFHRISSFISFFRLRPNGEGDAEAIGRKMLKVKSRDSLSSQPNATPRTQTYIYLPVYLLMEDFLPNYFFDECAEKPAVCSKFRECTKATGNIKSVSPLSPNGLIELFN